MLPSEKVVGSHPGWEQSNHQASENAWWLVSLLQGVGSLSVRPTNAPEEGHVTAKGDTSLLTGVSEPCSVVNIN